MTKNIFCFEFDQPMIDKNYNSIGNYLNSITNGMKVEIVFGNFAYQSYYLAKEKKNIIEIDLFQYEFIQKNIL